MNNEDFARACKSDIVLLPDYFLDYEPFETRRCVDDSKICVLENIAIPNMTIVMNGIDIQRNVKLVSQDENNAFFKVSFLFDGEMDFISQYHVTIDKKSGSILFEDIENGDLLEGDIAVRSLLIAISEYLELNGMLLSRPDCFDLEEKVYKKSDKKRKASKHGGCNVVRHYKCYTIRDLPKREEHKRKIKRHCLAWSVRGHYRHYKNGKVVFVEQYMKGKKKEAGNYEPKRYKVVQ